MILIIHRKHDGSIIRIYEHNGATDELVKAVEKYNASDKDDKVEFITVEDNSAVAWLYKYRRADIKNFREQLTYIERLIDDLSSNYSWLADMVNKDDK